MDSVDASTNIDGHEKWIEIRAKLNSKGDKYFFLHENRCDGVVAVIPYKVGRNGEIIVFYIKERTPCWGDEPVSCSLTGGNDIGHKPEETALKELWEETGIKAPTESLISLGECYGTKCIDTVYSLYAIDVTRLEATNQPERGISVHFAPLENSKLQHIKDPIFHVLYNRLQHTASTIGYQSNGESL